MFSGLPFRRRENVAATTPLVPEDRVLANFSQNLKPLPEGKITGRIVAIRFTHVLRRIQKFHISTEKARAERRIFFLPPTPLRHLAGAMAYRFQSQYYPDVIQFIQA